MITVRWQRLKMVERAALLFLATAFCPPRHLPERSIAFTRTT